VQIGGISLKNNVVLAPMAGFTDTVFRVIVMQSDCGLVYSEMVSAKGLVMKDKGSLEFIAISDKEHPIAVQIFGNDPRIMADAAKMVEDAGADIVDINMGCPTPKIVKEGYGAALMKDPELVERIVYSVVKAVSVPVTVKMRKGWDDKSVTAVEIARRAENGGASCVVVHGRTREQFYRGQADWGIIRDVVMSVSIPVIGNGDITSPEDAEKMLQECQCAGVMIGRAARGNPWLLERIVHYLQHGVVLPKPSSEERIDMMFYHLDRLVELKGEYVGIREMRAHAVNYVKGLSNASYIRNQIMKTESVEQFKEVVLEMTRV
jgi:tRNA-dihydrouridine synthase B